MPLPATFVMATLRYGVASRPLQMNVLWYTIAGAVGGTDGQNDANIIADAVASNFNDELAAVTTSETTLVGVQAVYNNAGNVFVGVGNFTSLVGNEISDTLPEYCAVIVQKRTATGGKRGRGRVYMGCVPETFAENGETTLVSDALYDAFGNKLKLDVTAGGATLTACHCSKAAGALYPIISTHTVGILGTERRRKPRPLI